jgi:hypothetical protein
MTGKRTEEQKEKTRQIKLANKIKKQQVIVVEPIVAVYVDEYTRYTKDFSDIQTNIITRFYDVKQPDGFYFKERLGVYYYTTKGEKPSKTGGKQTKQYKVALHYSSKTAMTQDEFDKIFDGMITLCKDKEQKYKLKDQETKKQKLAVRVPRTESQKTKTALLKKNNIIRKEKEMNDDKKRIELYSFKKNEKAKYPRFQKLFTDTRDPMLFKLNFCCAISTEDEEGNKYIYGRSRHINSQEEFDNFIDNSISLLDADQLIFTEMELYRNAREHGENLYDIESKYLETLFRQSKNLPYKNTIKNALVKNTKMNTNCIDAIMEYL